MESAITCTLCRDSPCWVYSATTFRGRGSSFVYATQFIRLVTTRTRCPPPFVPQQNGTFSFNWRKDAHKRQCKGDVRALSNSPAAPVQPDVESASLICAVARDN